MLNQKGTIALIPVFLFIGVVLFLIFIANKQGYLALPSNPISNKLDSEKSNAIAPDTQYQNPFDKNAQYVNPFSSYKNPFEELK